MSKYFNLEIPCEVLGRGSRQDAPPLHILMCKHFYENSEHEITLPIEWGKSGPFVRGDGTVGSVEYAARCADCQKLPIGSVDHHEYVFCCGRFHIWDLHKDCTVMQEHRMEVLQ